MNYRYRTTSSISFGGPLTPVVKQLIIACTLIYVVQLILSSPYQEYFAYYFCLTPALVLFNFFVWQLFTYMFLHGGLWHLVFNMLALFMFGCELERCWGSRRFFTYYMITGIGAGLCVFLFPFNYGTPTLGASGAIYGLLLAYGLLFPTRVIYLYLVLPLQARYFVIVMGAIAFLSALSTPNSGISNIAHLGGMLFGYIYLRHKIPHPFTGLKKAYYEWKLQRARRKFMVYLNDKEKQNRKGPTIH